MHEKAQALPTQVAVPLATGGQGFAQLPQFAGSEVTFAQDSLQTTVPIGQFGAHVHWKLPVETAICPTGQSRGNGVTEFPSWLFQEVRQSPPMQNSFAGAKYPFTSTTKLSDPAP